MRNALPTQETKWIAVFRKNQKKQRPAKLKAILMVKEGALCSNMDTCNSVVIDSFLHANEQGLLGTRRLYVAFVES